MVLVDIIDVEHLKNKGKTLEQIIDDYSTRYYGVSAWDGPKQVKDHWKTLENETPEEKEKRHASYDEEELKYASGKGTWINDKPKYH